MNKNPYIDMRDMMKKMRNAQKGIYETPKSLSDKKDPSTRDLVGKMRRLNEDVQQQQPQQMNKNILGNNIATHFDQENQESMMNKAFADLDVTLEYEPLEIYDNRDETGNENAVAILWGGSIGDQVNWHYTVTIDKSVSGVEIDYVPSYDRNIPENKRVIEEIEKYFDTFSQWWIDNLIQNK